MHLSRTSCSDPGPPAHRGPGPWLYGCGILTGAIAALHRTPTLGAPPTLSASGASRGVHRGLLL